jgi:CTP:molybdopterin cytidylyltransferase MocA
MSAGTNSRRIGVILAAGRGRRMGGTKQLLSWQGPDGTKPLIAAAYDAIRPICHEMIVVVGHEADAVAAALGKRKFYRVEADPDFPMFESIRTAMRTAQKIDPTASVVLQPGDQPAVAPSTLQRLIDLSYYSTKAIIPQFEGRGGHPILIPPSLAATLITIWLPNQGLNALLAYPTFGRRTVVDDPSILRDIDTPHDLPQ